MTPTFPKPSTLLPWDDHIPRNVYAAGEWVAETNKDDDAAYIIHAANAFPHLVAALEEIDEKTIDYEAARLARRALAIARGETLP